MYEFVCVDLVESFAKPTMYVDTGPTLRSRAAHSSFLAFSTVAKVVGVPFVTITPMPLPSTKS